MTNIIAERDAQAKREKEARDSGTFMSEVFGPWLISAVFVTILLAALMIGMLALEPGGLVI